MQANKSLDNPVFFCKCSRQQRLIAAIIFLLTAGLFAVLWLAANGKIDLGYILNPCGFKQAYGLPCPTCGITTSATAFAGGDVFRAFYIQPAGALLCCCLIAAIFLSLFTLIFGVYFRFLNRLASLKIKYLLAILFIIIIAGWAVTLARTLAEKK
jgi:hypothetical protein